MTRRSTRQTHDAGEHAVITELSRRGVDAEHTRQGRKGVHLLAMGKSLEVRAKGHTSKTWLLPIEGSEADISILVSLTRNNRAKEFFVLPTGTLYDQAKKRHDAHWNGRQLTEEAKDYMRVAPDEIEADYRDAWHMVVGDVEG